MQFSMDIDVYLKRFGWALNLMLIAALSYTLAQGTSSLIEGRYLSYGPGEIEIVPSDKTVKPIARTRAGLGPIEIKDIEKAIIDRNLFKAKIEEIKINDADVDLLEPMVKEIDALLLGVIAGKGKKLATIEIKTPKPNVGVYMIGDTVNESSATVENISIERDEDRIIPTVVLSFPSGARQELVMDFSRKIARLKTRPGERNPKLIGPLDTKRFGGGDTIKRISATEYQIDQAEFNAALENLNELITTVRMVPNFTKDRKVDGFRVFQIKPKSIFQKLGLRNGDVLHRINNIELNDAQKGMEAFTTLRNRTSFTIDLKRRNRNMTFTYEVK